MTDRYFDWYLGSDSNNGLTPSTPKQSYDAYRAAGNGNPGDVFYTKRGTPQIISTANTGAKVGANNGQRTRFAAYGEAQVPYSIWTNPSAASDFILNASGLSNIDFEDMYFDGLGVVSYSLYMLASGATANSNHKVSRCYFTNMKVGGSGLVIGGTATSTGDTSNYLIEDSYFFLNPTHGMLINGAHDVLVRRSKFYGNGFNAIAGGHGLSCKARRTTASSGWTNTSGTIWQRTLAAYETAVYQVNTNVTLYRRLAENTGTPTAPAAGEFGVSGGILYVNVGSASNPSGQSVTYSWGRCYNIVVEDCESYENVADPQAPSTEGHGFAADDFSDHITFRRNLSHHNQGAAFSINKGDDNVIESNIGHNNNLPGVVLATGWRANIKHNTFFDNNQSGEYASEIAVFTYAKDGKISNNSMEGSTAKAIDIDSTCTGFGKDGPNAAYGYGAVEGGSLYTDTITVAPQRTASRRPRAAALLGTGTALGGRDFYGRPFHPTAPNIGAVESVPVRTAVSRTPK
jgi:parallel beta-helix repeat protein